ncbi:hypothetical protein BSKO_10088 [Bryopsis sp. KO-2023]|nr:hypothetical protein BSKO_10088 [Bryopsis sp. KO-2023]
MDVSAQPLVLLRKPVQFLPCTRSWRRSRARFDGLQRCRAGGADAKSDVKGRPDHEDATPQAPVDVDSPISVEDDVSETIEVGGKTVESTDSRHAAEAPVVRKTFFKSVPVNPPPTYYPSWNQSPGGLIMACAVLVSIRLGRQKSEEDRLDWRTMQLRQEEYLNQNRELVEKRKQYEIQQAETKAAEATKRVAEVERQAKIDAEKEKERLRRYKEEQEKEAARIKAKQEADRLAFKAEEDSMADELAKRTEVEKKIIQEMEAKKKEEDERKRKEEEERQRIEMEKQRAAEEAERKRIEEEKRKKEEERKRIEKMKKKFAVRAEGLVAVVNAPRGKMTRGVLPKEAKISVEVQMQTVLVPEPETLLDFFEGYDQARKRVGDLTGVVARQLADKYTSSVRVQSMASSGPLELMDELELEHWMRRVSIRCELAASQAAEKVLQTHKDGRVREAEEGFEIRSEWGILPKGNEGRTDFLLAKAVDSLLKPNGKNSAKKIILEMAASEATTLSKGLVSSKLNFEILALATTLAHFIDRTMEQKSIEMAEKGNELMQEILQEAVVWAPKDSLAPVSETLTRALGMENSVRAWMTVLADRNLSKATKQLILEQQQLIEAELKAKVMQQEWPDRQELAAARAQEAEDATPVPERVWAMRNVARTLSMGSSLSQAKSLIEKALRLQVEHLETKDHPGVIPALFDYAQVLSKLPGEEQQAQSVWEDVLALVDSVGDRYRKQGDLASAVISWECGVKGTEVVLGERNRLVKRMIQKAESLESALDGEEESKVTALRRSGLSFNTIVSAFTPDLGVYKVPGKTDRLEEWSSGSQLTPL